jgi:transposase
MDTLALTSRQRRRLKEQLRSTRDARVYRRTLAVLDVAAGESVSHVADHLGVTPRAVYHWLANYDRDRDPGVLADRVRSGRPARLSEQDRDQLRRLLASSPQEHGYPAVTWTVPLLAKHLRSYTDSSPSADTLRRELQRLDYTWKRPRYRLDPDPEARGKKEANPATH